jgi:hypothetical protein
VENRGIYHRTVVWIAVGEPLFFEASLKTADAAMTKANKPIIAAKSIDLGSRPRLSTFLCMDRAPVTDASKITLFTIPNTGAIIARLAFAVRTGSESFPC